ncbi:hypothetical protein IQ270_26890 [Microcoleus sp. LEGE 07076]|nr:hypothetical protein [Microcoleus sp. LEGE 07076]MBE9188165.1 hypothetical protein [Microcoleus sp. LEGE 07076]
MAEATVAEVATGYSFWYKIYTRSSFVDRPIDKTRKNLQSTSDFQLILP